MEAPKDYRGLEKTSLTPQSGLVSPWGCHSRRLTAGVSVFSPVRRGESFLPRLPPRRVLRIREHKAWEKTRGVTDVREVTILPSPSPSGPNAPGVPVCPPHPPKPRSFSAARLNVNTQGKLQGKHTADKNLMLYVTKQNEYLIRAFMRNHITNRPHAAVRAVLPLPALVARRRQRSS